MTSMTAQLPPSIEKTLIISGYKHAIVPLPNNRTALTILCTNTFGYFFSFRKVNNYIRVGCVFAGIEVTVLNEIVILAMSIRMSL